MIPSQGGIRDESIKVRLQPSAQPKRSRGPGWRGILSAFLLIAGGLLLLRGLPASDLPSSPLPPDNTIALASSVAPLPAPAATAPADKSRFVTADIEDLRVGDWVLSGNPEVTDHERETFEEVDPGSWRKLDLRMEKRDGGHLELVLLRPVEWVNSVGAKAGGNVHLDLPELGAEGNARVVSIGPCPEIGPAPSAACQLVTGTFAHSSGEILDIRVEGLEKPIGVTANHPFYSEDAKTFVPAGKLSPGELLRQANGQPARVTQITKRTTPAPVFNLEVNGEHTYHISKTALLVHNSCAEHFGYRVMDIKELESIKRFGWSTRYFDDTVDGYKWLWKSRKSARSWLKYVRKNESVNSIIVKVRLKKPFSSYSGMTHSKPILGRAAQVPISDLSL